MNIQWSRQARQDLRAIHEFIARDSEHYARLQIKRLIERVEYISRMPTMGHRVHEFPELDLRETHQENYRIIYAHEADELQVVTIVHMKQQMKKRRLSK
jgi:toxin ParE1/3/4